ncbi:hypothetical protein FB446DRAFT_805567 [Lentinula raphanica]|nr:hypothetical protein FB446DRAFT_805567 [Lentinula raphanica]
MSPDGQKMLVSEAQAVLSDIVNLIVTITGYGAFVLGITIAILSLLRRYPLQHSPTIRGLLVCLIVIFICFTWTVFDSGGFILAYINYTLVRSLPAGLGAQLASADNHTIAWQYMPTWAQMVNILLSDCIVAWRAWILLQQERFWRLALVALMVANIVVGIAYCIWDIFQARAEATGYITLNWISNTLSLTVNLLSTFLIAIKAWNLHCSMINAGLHQKTRVQRILLLLVESGAVYCVIESVYEVVAILTSYTAIGTHHLLILNTISSTSIVVSACYPVAVMILAYNDISPVAEIETFNLQTMHNSHSNSQTAVGGRDRTGVAEV